MSTVKPAKTYPDTIFKQKTPDEAQQLNSGPRFNTWYKGWFTRSEIYERMMPDGLTSALRMEGPDSGGAAIVMNSKGNLKLITGVRTEAAGTGTLDIKTHGCNQLHNGRTNIQYNPGGTENEEQALNVLCYGDVVEQIIGGTKHVTATKIVITATEGLYLNGNTVSIKADGKLQMAGASITTAQVNKKDIITGQKMTFGAGETTDMNFDSRASINTISPGNVYHKVLGNYEIKSFRRMTLRGVTELFLDCPATTTVQGTKSLQLVGPGGMNLTTGKTTFETADFDVTSDKIDMTATKADVSITGKNVRVTGDKIYLN